MIETTSNDITVCVQGFYGALVILATGTTFASNLLLYLTRVQNKQATMADPEVNYFVCTLDQAALLNERNPHAYKTINEFFDERAQSSNPAVGFPRPLESPTQGEGKVEWQYEILSTRSPLDI